jgi:dolichol-phosphate mannosyltransferase
MELIKCSNGLKKVKYIKMSNLNLTIIIPCLNESDNLRKLIPEIKTLIGKKLSFEIFIIDGIKTDIKTLKIAKNHKIKYLNRKISNNYGNAVKLGIKKSSGLHTLFMDGDFSHEPKFILKLYNKRINDVVIASRYTTGGKTDNLFVSEFLSKILNIFYNFVLNLNLKDVSNSFRLYNTKKLKKLNLKSNHFDIIVEIIFKLKLANYKIKIKEIPYHFRQRKFGKTKRNFFIVIAYLFSILKIRLLK